MTLRKIINRLRRNRPTSYADFRAATGVNLVETGCGVFRKTFRLQGYNVVVKFPLEDYGVVHSRREIRRIREVMRKKTLRHLVRYAPKLFYVDYKNGIVVMEKLSVVNKDSSIYAEIQKMTSNLIEDTFRNGSADSKYCNLGYNSREQLKLLDWGCV